MSTAAATGEHTEIGTPAPSHLAPGVVTLSDHLRASFPAPDAFDQIMQLDGDVFRQHKHRRTIRVTIGGRPYFVKIHDHSGAAEVLKNIAHLRLPILTARPEYEAIRRLTHMGVPTMTVAGFGVRGRNPARLRSFIITEELRGTTSLESLVPEWNELPRRQRAMIRRAAAEHIGDIARRLHDGGINHRDFYLCHFLVRDQDWPSWRPADGLSIALIDLHRVQIRRTTPRRWRIKDLAGLFHSALDEQPSDRELLRFWRAYRGTNWKQSLRSDQALIDRVIRRARRQYRSRHGTPPPRAASPANSA